MSNRRHIEELRDMFSRLKQEAEFLYRYGRLASLEDFFKGLSLEDKKRLIYLGLTEGDKDIQNVANYFMKKLSPTPENPKELLAQMSSDDKAELAELIEDKLTGSKYLTPIDEQRISEELRKACNQIGFLEVEEAFWILIPKDPAEDSSWIKALGGKDETSESIRLPNKVLYEPPKEEKYKLLTDMRKALWVLHVHNHPKLSGHNSICEPSGDDLGFALHWKSLRPELPNKSKFFVVQENMALEYSLPQGGTERWSEPE